MLFVYVSETAWGLLFTWRRNGNMFLSCQNLKDGITWISEGDKQTEKNKLDLMESIISEQGSFVTCGCVRERGIRHDIILFSPQLFATAS